MKKVTSLLAVFFILTGCAETFALLGPASTMVGGSGNIVQSSLTSAANYGIKKKTGKNVMEHALAYSKEKNPNKKKDRCVSFVKQTDSEACYIAKKQISLAKKSTTKKIKTLIETSKFNLVKKIKIEDKNSSPSLKEKKTLLSKKSIETKLEAVETILKKNIVSKNQIEHLHVSINKSFKIKNLKD